ncbi:MAG: pilus assembly FimT family protein [Planctomycetota bacterium]
MCRRAYTLVEVLLVIALMGLIAVFVFPNLGVDIKRRSLVESADRLRSLIIMTHARAMQDGLKYRIQFPGTADPDDPQYDPDIDIPQTTKQPIVERQKDPLDAPDQFEPFRADWKDQQILQEGTRCVAVLPGQPNFEVTMQSEIAGPSISRDDKSTFVSLIFHPDGTTESWITFVLTDLPVDIDVRERHVGRILNVIVDGRTGQTWIQRALRVREVELMKEKRASPILHLDFTRPDLITEANILEIHYRKGGVASGGRSRSSKSR